MLGRVRANRLLRLRTPQQALHHDEQSRAAGTDDFASALETFTTESEEAASEDHVVKGTVLKLTGYSRRGRYRREVRGHAAAFRSSRP